ncbi:DinB family protein [Vibrio sp. SCSIO 43136]|uniref:DinB family protein n=1 Tax=Vibrio sp. SCSIO 43136 TaxID=2819101 RepID=UPI0020755717|nr:DinB family protein [Vibrio sp. SCSIO 43136]USD67654.1 DinB family protein [Vibrio sp. SCSIO 43136]
MNIVQHFQSMAIYNQRINQQLIKACYQLNEDQLHQETHAFFSTIMAHWNHLLFADLIMLQRMVANDVVNLDAHLIEQLPVSKRIHDTFVDTLEELAALRTAVDTIYVDVTQALTTESCQQEVSYTTTEGQLLSRSLGAFLQHVFNHQTHHKGQLTALLSQFGVDYGCMDLPVVLGEVK